MKLSIVLDVPDSEANAKVFGYFESRTGTKAILLKVCVMLVNAIYIARR